MRLSLLISLAIAIVGLTAAAATGLITTCPMSVKVESRSVGKGFHCRASVTITNSHDFPVWFVMAWAANELLPYDGTLGNGSGWRTNDLFEASAYDEGHGRVIIVSYYGTNDFKAILLPPRGQMRFEGFMFFSGREPPRFVDFWEVKRLLVNGKTSLQDWMPFSLESSKDTYISWNGLEPRLDS
jgi:hypothetical protein